MDHSTSNNSINANHDKSQATVFSKECPPLLTHHLSISMMVEG